MTTPKYRLLPTLLLSVLAACGQSAEFIAVPEPPAPLRSESERGEVPAEARVTDYALEARLDAETHQVEGASRVTWRNTTSRSVDTIPFHLYMNAFRAEDTAWMQSSGGRHRGNKQSRDNPWGYIDVHSVKLEEKTSLVVTDEVEEPGVELVELPFEEDADPTTMTVRLPRPVGPGESVTLELDFTTQLPDVYARTGTKDGFYAVGQWFPKIAVLEEDGWDAHTFTYNDEFYADFGHYSAALDVPEDMIVGATGVRTAEEIVDGRKLLTYEAEMVHDFAFFADADFVETYGDYNGIRVRQLIQPELVATADDHMDAVVAAFESYERRFGPYPWSTLTVVHPPPEARGAGGMEYPTLFTSSDRTPLPGWVRRHVFDERESGLRTTVHEFGHQYFQGLFASREHSEPWLDEGMNSFSNALAFLDQYQEDPWSVKLFGQKLYPWQGMHLIMRFKAFHQPVAQPASAFRREIGNYGMTVYMKVSALMMTLRNTVGAEAFDRALSVYSEEARFDHPRGSELEAVLVRELGGHVNLAPDGAAPVELDVARYLEQALRTTRRVEFSVVSAVNRRRGDAGWHRDESGELTGGEAPPETELAELPDDEVEGAVAVHRHGGFVVPVEIEVEFTDGSRELFWWPAEETTAVWTWSGRRLRRVEIDPGGKLLLEADRFDNMKYVGAQGEEDGLSTPLGHLGQALVLALLGGLAP